MQGDPQPRKAKVKKKYYRSAFLKRLQQRVLDQPTPESVQQLNDIKAVAERPRYPDETGVAAALGNLGITDTLRSMLGDFPQPTITGKAYASDGQPIPAGYFPGGTAGEFYGEQPGLYGGSHIAIRPSILADPKYAEDVLIHEFGHALSNKMATRGEYAWGNLHSAMAAAPTKDPYSRQTNTDEQFAQTFREAVRMLRAHDTTDMATSEDSLPGTRRMYQTVKKLVQ